MFCFGVRIFAGTGLSDVRILAGSGFLLFSSSRHLINLIKLKTNLTVLIYCNKYSILRNEFYKKKNIEHIMSNFQQLSSLQIIGELMTSSNHYINIQLAKFLSSYFNLRA